MSEMTLSQALRRLKQIKGVLAENIARSFTSVSNKLGDDPAFKFVDLEEKIREARIELIKLKASVAYTNASTNVTFEGASISLAAAVIALSELKAELKWLEDLKSYVKNQKITSEESREYDYQTEKSLLKKTEFQCYLPEAERAERVSQVKARFEALNDVVEAANHRTSLVTSGQVGK